MPNFVYDIGSWMWENTVSTVQDVPSFSNVSYQPVAEPTNEIAHGKKIYLSWVPWLAATKCSTNQNKWSTILRATFSLKNKLPICLDEN